MNIKTRDLINALLLVAALVLVWNGRPPRPAPQAAPAITNPKGDAAGHITVTGSSAIRVVPDRVVVVLGVETFAQTPSASRADNARLSKEVRKAIRGCSVAERDIATADFDLRPRYDDYERNKISGYGASNTIAVTLHDVDKLEDVLVAALEAGATSVYGIEFSVTNLRELRDQAREMAVEAALEKADDMAAAAGVQRGGVTNIHEDAWDYGYMGWFRGGSRWTNTQNVVQNLAEVGAVTLEDGGISLGKISVKAQVSLTAEIVP